MAPPRATRGGVAAADAAREKERAEQERAEKARAALVVAEVDVNLDSHLLVDKDNRINNRAKHHAKICQEVLDEMAGAAAALEHSVRAHLVRKDVERAAAAREHLREVLLARRRLEAQARALDALVQSTGGHLQYQCDKKLKPKDWRAKVDEGVAGATGGGWRVDREPELANADRLARLAKVKLHPGMASEEGSDDEGGNDGGGAGGGGGDDSDDSIRVEQRGPLRGVQNARCPISQKPIMELERPVKDSRGYVYERDAVLAAVEDWSSRHRWQLAPGQPKRMPHPVAGAQGDLTEAELAPAHEVTALRKGKNKSDAAKFARDVRRCEKAGATAAAVRERQQREAAANAAKAAGARKGKASGGGGKKKKAAGGGGGGAVTLGDSDDDEEEAAAAAAGPSARARSAELDDDLGDLVIVDEDGEDEEAAAAAYLAGGEDEDEEEAAGVRGAGGRPRRAAAQRQRVVQESSSDEGDDDEDMIEDDDGAARRQADVDDEDDVLSA